MNVLKFLLMAVLLQNGFAPNASTAKNGSIEGIVVGAGGEPLAKVEVTLKTGLSSFQIQPGFRINTFSLDSSSAELLNDSVTTGSDGRFAFEGLSPGKYHITAERPGYVRTEFGQRGPNNRGQALNLNEGEKRHDVRLSMLATGTITGHILDSNGEPVIGARVQALKYSYTPQGRSLTPVATVITDDTGAYRLFWLPPGTYIVSASLSPSSANPLTEGTITLSSFIPKRNTIVSRALDDGTNVDEIHVPVYYPGGVATPDNAVPIIVRGGSAISGTDMTMAPVRVFKIRGKTINTDSGQIDYASILLSPKSVMNGVFPERRIQIESTGYFEIPGVVPGSYLLFPDPPFEGAPLPVEVGNSDVNNANLSFSLPTLSSNSGIPGRILIEGMTQSLTNSKEARRLNLSPMVGPRELSFISVAVDGTFSTKGILPGDYRISLQGEPSYFIKRVRLGNQEAVGNIVNLNNAAGGNLEVVLTASRGKIEGRVLNERHEPVTNGTVVLVPETPLRDRTDLYFLLNLNESGKFSGEAMPGHYVIYTWEDIEPYAWLDADYMKRFENRGRPVNIIDGGNESVDVSIIPYVP